MTLPCKVNPEQTTASVKDGVLTVTLAKAAEAQPRQISVRAQ
jgi:HSP20 family protein